MSNHGIADLIKEVEMDENARRVFLAMPREEQLLAILGMIAFLRSELAIMKRDSIQYRQKREKREKILDEILDTDPKIKALTPDEKETTLQKIIALATRPARPGYLLDKILTLIVLILAMLFYLFVTGKLS